MGTIWGGWTRAAQRGLEISSLKRYIFRALVFLAISFFNATASAGLGGAPSGALAVFDFDGDGDLDALLGSSEPGGTKLYINQGGFFKEAPQGLISGVASLSVADYDLDGDLDVLAASSSPGSPVLLLRNEGTGLKEVSAGFSGGKCSRLALALDYNCDGWPDVFEAASSCIAEGGCRLWEGDGIRFKPATPPELAEARFDIYSAAIGNLDEDPNPEVVIAGGDGLTAYDFSKGTLWRQEGDFKGVRLADLDGDGSLEVVAASEAGVCAVAPDGSGTCQHLGLKELPPLRDIAVVDYNLDGRQDIFAITVDGKPLFLKAGESGFSDATDEEGLGGMSGLRGAVFADYDGDGDPDLFLLTEEGLALLENEGQPDEFVRVRLEGALPGDEITLYGEGRALKFVVGQAATSLCSAPPEASFPAGNWDSLVVSWTCGLRSVRKAPKGAITLANPGKASRELEEENLLKVTPNPAVGFAMLVYEVPEPGPVELRVSNSQGNTVKVLERGYKAPGVYVVKWDGTDNSGRVVPKGVYFVNYSLKGRVWRQKVVWVPF